MQPRNSQTGAFGENILKIYPENLKSNVTNSSGPSRLTSTQHALSFKGQQLHKGGERRPKQSETGCLISLEDAGELWELGCDFRVYFGGFLVWAFGGLRPDILYHTSIIHYNMLYCAINCTIPHYTIL